MRAISSSLVPALMRAIVLVAIVAAAGCAQVRYEPPPPSSVATPPAGNEPRYEPVPAQDAATIAELRAGPAPGVPEVGNGTSVSGDERVQNARGFVRIGDGYYPAGDDAARNWALKQGQRVGADKILLYDGDPAAKSSFMAVYYVRYRLPFGATFRSLSKDEQATLGSGGVQIGEVVGGTPASEANLRNGDFVIKFNGKAFADKAAFQELLREHLGKRVTLTISRGGVTTERLVRLGVTVHTQGETR